MPPANAIDTHNYELRLKWTLHNQECFNVLHFNAHGSPDLINDLLIPVLACVTDNLLPVLSSECKLIEGSVKDLTDPTQTEYTQAATGTGLGTESAQSLPGFNSAVIRLKTSHGGRSGRGRMSLLGIPEDRAAQGSIDATFIAAAVAFIACMIAAYVAGDPPAANQFYWAVRSRKLNAFYPVTQAVVNPLIGTMRSRKIR